MPVERIDPRNRLSLPALKEALKLYARFNRYAFKYRGSELALILLGNISTIFLLSNPYIGKVILDRGVLGKDAGLFFRFTFIGAAIYLLRQAADKGEALLKNYVVRKIKISLSKDVLNKTSRLGLASFQSASSGDFIARLSNDINFSGNVIAGTLPDVFKAASRLIFITAIILFINWKLLALILAYQSVVIAQTYFFTRRSEALTLAIFNKTKEMAKILTQVFSQVYYIKASGSMHAMLKKYFHSFAQMTRIEARIRKVEISSGVLSDLSGKIFLGAIGLAGAMLVMKGQLTLGSLGAAMAYLVQGTAAYTGIVTLCQRMILSRLSLERVSGLLDAQIDIKEKAGIARADITRGKIEFKDVSFAYAPDRRILERNNFIIMPGNRLALVGSSGCGKTTIANLVLRLYDVSAGAVLLDDRDVRDMRLKSIYSGIGLAPQSPFMWGDSIRSNIEYGDMKIGSAAVKDAARIAEIGSFIDGLPDGYDTLLSDMVLPLSEGQKQRIAIARAVAKCPKILILDEACSSLDSKTEEMVMDNIIDALPKTTLIVVTHRLSAVKKMGKAYFLKSLREIKVSTHAELAEGDAQYRELFAGQFD